VKRIADELKKVEAQQIIGQTSTKDINTSKRLVETMGGMSHSYTLVHKVHKMASSTSTSAG
jgi:hypothetical protein